MKETRALFTLIHQTNSAIGQLGQDFESHIQRLRVAPKPIECLTLSEISARLDDVQTEFDVQMQDLKRILARLETLVEEAD